MYNFIVEKSLLFQYNKVGGTNMKEEIKLFLNSNLDEADYFLLSKKIF